MPRQKRDRSAPEEDDDAMERESASDDDEALTDDDEEAGTDDEEVEEFEECEEMDEDEDEDIDQCSKIGSRLPPRILLMPYYIMYDVAVGVPPLLGSSGAPSSIALTPAVAHRS